MTCKLHEVRVPEKRILRIVNTPLDKTPPTRDQEPIIASPSTPPPPLQQEGQRSSAEVDDDIQLYLTLVRLVLGERPVSNALCPTSHLRGSYRTRYCDKEDEMADYAIFCRMPRFLLCSPSGFWGRLGASNGALCQAP